MIVSKFGGSSVASSTQFKKVKNIITANKDRSVVIISALGKKSVDDIKTTDLLYTLHSLLVQRKPYEEVLTRIEQNFYDVVNELGLKFDMESEFVELRGELNAHISKDFVITCGEYFTAKIMAEYLGYQFVDAVDLIIFEDNGTIDNEETDSRIAKAYEKYGNIVIPGFYGANKDGTVKAFSRGGSDVSGAIVARALKSSVYENWTDVSGILIADPRIIGKAKRIDEISYDELRELSYMGASVLHEETIIPVREANIPIHILNTNDPTAKGTLVKSECCQEDYLIKGIAGKKDFTTFVIKRNTEVSKQKLIRGVMTVFDFYNINVEQVISNVDGLCVVVPQTDIFTELSEIETKLSKIIGVSEVSVDTDLALISILGRHFAGIPGVAGKIFSTIGDCNVNLKMFTYGINDISVIIGVAVKDYNTVVTELYKKLVSLHDSEN